MLSSHFFKQFSRALKIIIFGMLNLKSKMNKLILNLCFKSFVEISLSKHKKDAPIFGTPFCQLILSD